MANERTNYYSGQLLQKEDLTGDQEYHRQARKDHQGYFHNWGIQAGLDLSAGTGLTINISEGIAADIGGNLVRVPAAGAVADLTGHATAGTDVYIAVQYGESFTGEVTEPPGAPGFTRITEEATVLILDSLPQTPGTELILGKVPVTTTGGVVTSFSEPFDFTDRVTAGMTAGDLELKSLPFANNTNPANRPLFTGLDDGTKQVNLDGNLDITGDLILTGDLSITGSATVQNEITFGGTARTIQATNLEITDNTILVNQYAPQATPLEVNGGFEVFRGGDAAYPNAQVIWDETNDKWTIGREGVLNDLLYSNNLFVSHSTGNTSLGSSSFGGKLHITGGAAANSFNNTSAAMEVDNALNGNSVLQTNGTLGPFRWTTEDDSTRSSFLWNAHYNWAATSHKYDASNEIATMITTESGGLSLKTAPAGTAGTNITWSSAVNLTAGGLVGVGKTPTTDPLEIEGNIDANGSFSATSFSAVDVTATGDASFANITANADISGVNMSFSGLITEGAWQAATLANGWANNAYGYFNIEYMKDKHGFVHLRGRAKNGTTTDGTRLFTLPAGYVPPNVLCFPIVTNNTHGQINIFTSGTVNMYNIISPWVSLDGIKFYIG